MKMDLNDLINYIRKKSILSEITEDAAIENPHAVFNYGVTEVSFSDEDFFKIKTDFSNEDQLRDAYNIINVNICRDFFNVIISHIPEYNQNHNAGKKSVSIDLGTIREPLNVTKNNILDLLCDINTILDESVEVSFNLHTKRYVILPPNLCAMIHKKMIAANGQVAKNISISGLVGEFNGLTLFISNNLPRFNCPSKYYVILGGVYNSILYNIKKQGDVIKIKFYIDKPQDLAMARVSQ